MQVQQKSVTTAKSAKDYLSKNEIPQLFECLMTGLMYHRPTDYINYLQECLEKIKKQGVNAVHWDMFLESKKTPLPPIAATPKENFRPEPLPEIGTLHLKIDLNSSIIIIQGGPGIGKSEICNRLSSQFPEYAAIDLGLNIRERASLEAKDMKSKWNHVAELIHDGDLAPNDFVLETLIRELNNHSEKKNFLIDGYPRTVQERLDFERLIGFNKLKLFILIDCEEEICQQFLLSKPPNNEWKDHSNLAISKRIANYKSNTLAVCKYFDELGKLKIIDGGNESELTYREVYHVFNKEIHEVHSPCKDLEVNEDNVVESSMPNDEIQLKEKSVDEIPELTGITIETARKDDLPQCTFILLLGGPGSGKTETAIQLCKRYPSWIHIDMNDILRRYMLQHGLPDPDIAQTAEEMNSESFIVENLIVNINAVKKHLKSVDDGVQVIILEGYPKNKIELNDLNTEIGKIDFVILLDSEEDVMKYRLNERWSRFGSHEDTESNSENRIQYFKTNGLPLCRYYDERCQLNIVNSDRDIAYVIDEIESITSTLLKNSNNSALEEEPLILGNNESQYDDPANAAATTIQASIRGHLTRKRLKEERGLNATLEKVENGEEETSLALENGNENVETDVVVEDENNQLDENIEDENKLLFENDELFEEGNIEDPVDAETASLQGYKGVRTASQMDLMDANIILLLGGPGSGKKSLGDHLVIKYAMSFIHVDQLISNEINSNSEHADALNQCVESKFEDITPILILIRKVLVNLMKVSKNIVVAGFPKTFEQYRLFVHDVALVSAIIYLEVDSETMQSRLENEPEPDFTTNTVDLIQEFNDRNSAFIEEISTMDIFKKINGNGSIEEVLAEASEVIDHFSFIHSD